MGSNWNGFLPQNDVIKLQWAVMEACHTGASTEALRRLLANVQRSPTAESDEEAEDEDAWHSAAAAPGQSKD
ncbi:MAG TPA: hypothetical protein VHI52_17325 [Verrucomicrobiae bacterium]|nr:hypothetical protein [Verrucomicrobiae bacterium]